MGPLHRHIKETSSNTSNMALKNLVGNRKYPNTFVKTSQPQLTGLLAIAKEIFVFDAGRMVT